MVPSYPGKTNLLHVTEHFILKRSFRNQYRQDPRDKPVRLLLQSDYNNYSNNNSIVHVDDYYLLNISHA